MHILFETDFKLLNIYSSIEKDQNVVLWNKDY